MVDVEDAAEILVKDVISLVRLATRDAMRHTLYGERSGLSPTDVWILTYLIGEGPSRMSALADWQAVDRSTMTTHVHRLERLGLVERRRDPEDGRAILVSVSEQGHDRHDEILARSTKNFSDILRDWPHQDRLHLVTTLNRLILELSTRMH